MHDHQLPPRRQTAAHEQHGAARGTRHHPAQPGGEGGAVLTSPARKGREVENRAVQHLKATGYVVHRCIRHGVQRGDRWYSAGNDIWGCVDLLAKKRGERIRFIQVTSDVNIADKRRQLDAVPWDSAWECVEIWRWIKPKRELGGHFQRYLLDEGYTPDHANRVFPP